MKRKAVKRPFEEVSYKDICDKFIENIKVGLGGKSVWDKKKPKKQPHTNKKPLYFQMESTMFVKVGVHFFKHRQADV